MILKKVRKARSNAVSCRWISSDIDVGDTKESSQVDQEKEQSKLLIGDGLSSCHADKITPKDGNEQSKLSVDCTRTCKDRTKRRFDGNGIQSSLPSIGCNDIIIPDTEENSPGEKLAMATLQWMTKSRKKQLQLMVLLPSKKGETRTNIQHKQNS